MFVLQDALGMSFTVALRTIQVPNTAIATLP
jgi:hypothetical protein